MHADRLRVESVAEVGQSWKMNNERSVIINAFAFAMLLGDRNLPDEVDTGYCELFGSVPKGIFSNTPHAHAVGVTRWDGC